MSTAPSSARTQTCRHPLLYAGLVGGALLAVACLFVAKANEGRFHGWDQSILRALRDPADLGVPRGPDWWTDAMHAITTLGGSLFLTVVALTTVGVLLMRGARYLALILTLTYLGGVALNVGLKYLVDRPRPTVVPHLTEVISASFPSGHSLLSATIYLAVAGVVTLHASCSRPWVFFGLAVILSGLVGFSRVFLGVHFPSDVVAGWTIGATWSIVCLSIAARAVAGGRA